MSTATVLLKFETTRRVERVKERVLIGADNPVARGDVKREDKRREKETVKRSERERKRDGNRIGIKPGKTKLAGRRR